MAKDPKESKRQAAVEKAVKPAPATASQRALSPFEEMDRLFEGFFPRGWMHPFRWELPSWPHLPFEGKLPKVDIVERDNEVVIRAEVPGVSKDDLEVSMTDNAVTIKGSTSHEEKEEKGEYYRSEMSRGTFSRTVALPAQVDGAKAKASFKDGILELVAPKVEKAKRRSVKVE